MEQMEREENLPYGGSSGGGLTCPQNAAQFKDCGSRRNPPVTSLI